MLKFQQLIPCNEGLRSEWKHSLGLGTQEIKYRYTKSLDPKLIQINPVLVLKHYYLKINLNIIPIYYYILFNNKI